MRYKVSCLDLFLWKVVSPALTSRGLIPVLGQSSYRKKCGFTNYTKVVYGDVLIRNKRTLLPKKEEDGTRIHTVINHTRQWYNIIRYLRRITDAGLIHHVRRLKLASQNFNADWIVGSRGYTLRKERSEIIWDVWDTLNPVSVTIWDEWLEKQLITIFQPCHIAKKSFVERRIKFENAAQSYFGP